MSFNLSNLYRNILNDIFLHDTRLHLVDSITQKSIYKVCKYYFAKKIIELIPNNDTISSASDKIANATDENLMEVIIDIAKEIFKNDLNHLANINNFNTYYMMGLNYLSALSGKINGIFKKTELLNIFKSQYANSNHNDIPYIKSLFVSFLSSLFAKSLVITLDELTNKIIIDDRLIIDDKTEEDVYKITKEISDIIEEDDIFDLIV
jgi:hypothetical protein